MVSGCAMAVGMVRVRLRLMTEKGLDGGVEERLDRRERRPSMLVKEDSGGLHDLGRGMPSQGTHHSQNG